MEIELRKNLILIRDAYCSATGAATSTVAQSACGDWRFFDRIENGASFTARTYDRAIRWFSDRWPLGIPWPEEITRPLPASDEISEVS